MLCDACSDKVLQTLQTLTSEAYPADYSGAGATAGFTFPSGTS